jgi:hypothetical protein
MVKTPTITLNGNGVSEDGSGTNVIGNYTVQSILISPNGFLARAFKAIGGNRPASFSYWWTAIAYPNGPF